MLHGHLYAILGTNSRSMANKPKISHYAPSGPSDSKPANGRTSDRSRLAQLYPEPKTYNQRKQDDKLRQQAYHRHWPKRPRLNIAAYGSVILGLSIWFAQNLSSWWFGSSDKGITMATVFFTFALGLGLAFLLITWVNYVNKLFSYFGGIVQIFWLVYAVLISVLLTLWLSGWIWEYTNILWIPVLIVLHFIMVFFNVRRTIGKIS